MYPATNTSGFVDLLISLCKQSCHIQIQFYFFQTYDINSLILHCKVLGKYEILIYHMEWNTISEGYEWSKRERKTWEKMDSFPRFTQITKLYIHWPRKKKVQLLKIINEFVSITSECIEI